MRVRLSFTTFLLTLGVAALLVAGAANAFSISYYLDQTNTQTTDPTGSAYDPDNALPDGPLYLKVTFTDSTTPGEIDVTVDILSPLLSIADANFGLQSFFFNTTNSALLASEIIGLPSGWSASTDFDPSPPPQNADGFGGFEVMVADTGSSLQTPTLSFTIQSASDSIGDYADGDPFFAAHVIGLLDQNSDPPADDPYDGEGLCFDEGGGNFTPECNFLTSVWVAGSNPVPEPSTVLLLLGGLSGLALAGRRRLQ